MPSSRQFTSEQQLTERLANEIACFWQQGHFNHFHGENAVDIHYGYFTHQQTRPNLILVPGRCEAYLKYKELCYDLFQQGFNIFILDHRGQGLSERMLDNRQKGYVDDFQNYVLDLDNFIEHVVKVQNSQDNFILAHSMGGAIATRYLQYRPESIKAAVLASPMLGFNVGKVPEKLAENLINQAEKLNQWLGAKPWYFLGHKNFIATPFEDNLLSHSQARYQSYLDLYQKEKHLQLGGVTVKWLVESVKAQALIFQQLTAITTPVLVLQASKDIIIKNQAQDEFCQQINAINADSCPNGKAIVIDGAYHELFFEIDSYRNQALNHTLDWLEKHQ